MQHIQVKTEDRIANVFLDRGKSNAMDTVLLEELKSTIQTLKSDQVIEGVIIHGKEGFFSAGLDLITLYDYNEQEIKDFWELFLNTTQELASFPKPLVSAISGHSPAGGCVIALCCDYRIMAEGEFIIGLNEIPVGLIVPDSIFQLYSFWLGKANAYRFLLEGKLLKPQEALQVGLIDEVVAANAIQTAALRKIKSVTQFNKETWQTCKLNFRKELLEKLAVNQTDTIEKILTQWWKPSTRSILKTIIDNLKNKHNK
ncbi:enoyl-CoA hydratase/isomerase family protein [Sphingobacterium sp. SRCM116780]|uniref:enoyl-CoA hydratase/isomerase family protein n=1 Tax=Sphingobacterium sp. SRCM116780 TaxID=2907623 RepID=UPI001F1BEBA7|nr:enoyl-CoA hydratase/isomerase family protein [Sphingobacterium sp. SRCM116780]UIR55686.1 enoyl-CoA hydratase/isomerase family protein [Sphingobacterium sp. SRCM116780]